MKSRSDPTILDAVADRHLFAPWFERGDWTAWLAFLAALFGLPMTDEQRAFFERYTGRQRAPARAFAEAWLVVGRRGGKSFIAALVAVWLACFRDYREALAPGERGTVLVIAADRRQARTILRYVRALLEGVDMLSRMVERRTTEGIDLANRVSIEVHTASFRSVRGYTIVAALLDEVAFWRSDDTANPDSEILNAIRPGMATIPGALLLGLSSPYARRGVLFEAYQRHYGRDDSGVLVWQSPTRAMNPTVPQSVVDTAYEADPAAAAAEYGAEFRRDVETFLTLEAIEACQRSEPLEVPPVASMRYQAFVDPSGGASDSMTLAIGHREADRLVIDATRERRPPFSPESVVAEFADLLDTYRVRKVVGDRYAGEWPRERFREHGIQYEPAAKPKSDLYRDLLAHVNSARVELPPSPRLVTQLVNLERRTGRGGRDSIDHAPGAHDDAANAVAGLTHELAARMSRHFTVDALQADGTWQRIIGPADASPEPRQPKARQRLIHTADGRIYEETQEGD